MKLVWKQMAINRHFSYIFFNVVMWETRLQVEFNLQLCRMS